MLGIAEFRIQMNVVFFCSWRVAYMTPQKFHCAVYRITDIPVVFFNPVKQGGYYCIRATCWNFHSL